MISREEIQDRAHAVRDRLIELRRDFHRHPELSNKESHTAQRIRRVLEEAGVEVRGGIAGTGLLGLLRGERPGKTLALRADMDALPIQEKRETPYRSQVPRIMHACGHDAHMATVLGAAMVLSACRDRLPGNVKFLFQPAEEKVSGAQRMIAAGVLEDPDVSAILGFHVFPLLPTGVIGIKYGVMMASSDLFSIHIYGKAGHAAKPHLSVDAILIAAMVVNAIHHIISLQVDPVHPAVISIGKIQGGAAENIISDHVEMRGTIRAVTDEIRRVIARQIEETTRGIVQGMGGRYRFHLEPGSPPLDNHPGLTRLVEESAAQIVGADRVRYLEEPSMGGEDFSYYIERIPGTYFRVGTGNSAKDTCHYLHSDQFDVDEEAMVQAVKVLCWSALRYLTAPDEQEGPA